MVTSRNAYIPFCSSDIMKRKMLDTDRLIPTDGARKFKTIVDLIPLYVSGREGDIDSIYVVSCSDNSGKYFVCDGGHRGAAAYICKKPVSCDIITDEGDLDSLSEGRVGKIDSLEKLRIQSLKEAEKRNYLEGGWEEYLKDIAIFHNDFD